MMSTSCPNILKTDRRSKGTAVTYRLLHSDADLQVDLSKVAAGGGFAVGSGSPGHAHVYVLLAREATLTQAPRCRSAECATISAVTARSPTTNRQLAVPGQLQGGGV